MESKQNYEDRLIPVSNSSPEDPEVQDLSKGFSTYPERFYVLAVYCVTIIFASTLRLSFSAIDDEAQIFWGVDSSAIDWLVTGSYLLYPIGSSLGEMMQTRQGFVTMVRSAQALTLAGCCFRFLACFWENTGGYTLLLAGQIMGAVGLPPLLNSAGVLATAWFPLAERDNALACTVASYLLGLASSYLLPIVLVGEADDGTVSGMSTLLGLELGANLVGLVWLAQAVGAAPPTPPSAAAAQRRALDAEAKAAWAKGGGGGGGGGPGLHSKLDALGALVRRRPFALLCGGFSCLVGSYASLLGLVEEYSGVADFTDFQAGCLGAAFMLAGTVSVFIMSTLVTGRILLFPMLLWALTAGTFITGVWLVVAISPGGFDTALGMAIALGIIVNALVPIVLTLTVEAAFPLPESIPIGVTKSCSYLATVVGIESLHYFIEWQPSYVGIFSGANCFLIGLYLAGAVLLWSYRPELRRFEAEVEGREGGAMAGGAGLPPQQTQEVR